MHLKNTYFKSTLKWLKCMLYILNYLQIISYRQNEGTWIENMYHENINYKSKGKYFCNDIIKSFTDFLIFDNPINWYIF